MSGFGPPGPADRPPGTGGGGPGGGGPGGSSLGRAAARGAAVTFSAQGVRLVLQVGGIAVLGRLLSPTDYGLVAIVAVIVGYGELFRDFGLSSAVIAAKDVSRAQRDNLFWLNTGIGAVLALALAATSPLLARVFDEPRLAPVALALSGTFVLNGLSTQHRAMHARHLRFARLSGSEIGGQAVGLAAGITLALAGGGYWALVLQQLTAQLLTLVLVVTTHRWWPRRVDRGASIRPFLGYGSALLGSQLLTQVATSAAPLALGLRLGPASVGLFTRAAQLVTMPLLQLQAPSTRVALPVLSRLRDQRERFAAFLCSGQFALLTVVGLVFATLAAQGPSVVRVVVGPQWSAAVPVFQVLLVAGWFQAASYAGYWVYLAKGATLRHLQLGLMTRPLMAVATVLGARWGLEGAALAYAGGMALAWPLSLLWLRRVTDAPVGRMLGNGLRTGTVAAAAAAGSWGACAALPPGADVARLVLGTCATLAVAALAFALWPSFRSDARKVLSMRHHLGRSRRGAGAAGPASAGAGAATGASDPAAVDPAAVDPAAVDPAIVDPAAARRPAGTSARPVRGGRAGRLVERAWVTAGLPAAVDRAVVAAAVRRARRGAGTRADGAPARGAHLVVAAPGWGNIGDQALLEALLENTAGRVLLAVPGSVAPTLPHALAARVEVLDAPCLVYGPGRAHRTSLRTFGAALAGADHVSVVGADVMDGRYSLRASVRRSALATGAARAGVDTRVVGFSWGASPRRGARRELARAARAGVLVLARDPASGRRMTHDGVRGVRQSADVVFAARSVDPSAARALLAGAPDAPVALVNVSGLLAERADLLDDHVAVVQALRERGLHVVLLPHVWRERAGDEQACAAVAARLAAGPRGCEGVQVVREVLSPAQVRGLTARAAVTVTGRMHLAVMSLVHTVPAVTLASQGKVEGLMELVGAPRLCVAPRPGFSREVVALVDALLPGHAPERAAIAAALPDVVALALRNVEGLPPRERRPVG